MLSNVIPEPSRLAPRWYAVRCLPHRETLAATQLENQGFPAFLPLQKKTRRHARKLDMVLAPFFPGYLFVRLDLTRDRWRSVNGTLGVGQLVMRGSLPMPAPVGIVEGLREACDACGVLHRLLDFHPGQKVRIVSGAFAELIGELDQLPAADRVRVLLDLMGGRRPIVLPLESVVPAGV